MINIVDDILAKHSDAEIVEYLYRQMQTVDKYYSGVIVDGMDANLLLTQTETISLVADILKAIHKRNQERQAQTNMV